MRPNIRHTSVHLGILASLSLLLSACGEAFVGTYLGKVNVQNNQCNFQGGEHDIKVEAVISGSSIRLTVLEMVPTSGGAGSVYNLFQRSTASMSLNEDSQFNGSNNPMPPIVAKGQISVTREKIEPIEFLVTGTRASGESCTVFATNAGLGPLMLQNR